MLREDRLGCPQPGLAQTTPHPLGPCQTSATGVVGTSHAYGQCPTFFLLLSLTESWLSPWTGHGDNAPRDRPQLAGYGMSDKCLCLLSFRETIPQSIHGRTESYSPTAVIG